MRQGIEAERRYHSRTGRRTEAVVAEDRQPPVGRLMASPAAKSRCSYRTGIPVGDIGERQVQLQADRSGREERRTVLGVGGRESCSAVLVRTQSAVDRIVSHTNAPGLALAGAPLAGLPLVPPTCPAALFALCSARRAFNSSGVSTLSFLRGCFACPGKGLPVAIRRSSWAW